MDKARDRHKSCAVPRRTRKPRSAVPRLGILAFAFSCSRLRPKQPPMVCRGMKNQQGHSDQVSTTDRPGGGHNLLDLRNLFHRWPVSENPGQTGGQKDTLGRRILRILSMPPPCPLHTPIRLVTCSTEDSKEAPFLA